MWSHPPGSWVESLERRLLLSSPFAVTGVLPMALDQPRTNVLLSQIATGGPLSAVDGSGFSITGALDSGFAGTALSPATAARFGLLPQTFGRWTVGYDDPMAVNQLFKVSAPLYTSLATYPMLDPTDLSQYSQSSAPLPLELATQGPLGPLADVFGATQLLGKVMVIDPKPLWNTPPAPLHTFVYDPATPFDAANASSDPGIPSTALQVKLSYASPAAFTFESPAGAPAPPAGPIPFVGPNPFLALPDLTPPVTISSGGLSTTGSFLLDTGSTVSFISQALASQVGVHYRSGTYNSSKPLLVNASNVPLANQFTMQLSALGQTVQAGGFYLDSLTLQTQQGTAVQFPGAPVFVADIALEDPGTGQDLTLNGDLGMNFFVPGANVGAAPAAGSMPSWDWVTLDQPDGLLGLQPFAPSTVADAMTFYNNSAFDGNDPSSTAADDGAVAVDKLPLQSGQATFANVTSYSKGINGIMLDVQGLPASAGLSASDFVFRVGNSTPVSAWAVAPSPLAVAVRPGPSPGLSRVQITWADGAIRNSWLQVTVNADAQTGLSAPDVFYFGNLAGSSGQPPVNGQFVVGPADVTAAQNDPHTFLTPADITNPHDYNRDARVDALDQLIARMDSGAVLLDLSLSSTGTAVRPSPASPPPPVVVRRSAEGPLLSSSSSVVALSSGSQFPIPHLVVAAPVAPQAISPTPVLDVTATTAGLHPAAALPSTPGLWRASSRGRHRRVSQRAGHRGGALADSPLDPQPSWVWRLSRYFRADRRTGVTIFPGDANSC